MREDAISMAVRVLNEAVIADEPAIRELFNHRVPCNKALAGHESIQVGTYHEASNETGFSVGVLGIINGLFGIDEKHWGFIALEAADVDDSGKITKIRRFIDRRTETVRGEEG